VSSARTSDSDRSTEMTLVIQDKDVPEISDLSSFSYVSDCMQVSCPFSAEIPDPRSYWSARLRRGDKVTLYLSNPAVNQGRRAKKMIGRMVDLEQGNRPGTGRVLRVTGADLGWHLVHDFGPLGFAVNKTTYERLLKAVLDPSWGFAGVRWGDGNSLNRQVKLGRQQKLLNLTANGKTPLQYIGIEPGEQLSSLLTDVARFDASLLTVSADGYLQAWNPDYSRTPAYQFEYHGEEETERRRNNITDVTVKSSADPLYSKFTCVGEILLQLKDVDPSDPHPGRKIGRAQVLLDQRGNVSILPADKKSRAAVSSGLAASVNSPILPFFTQNTYVDTEQFDREYCQANAEWKARRALFDAWSYRFESPYHQQGGVWFESDMMLSLIDTKNYDDTYNPPRKIVGNYWCQSVELHWDKDRGGGTAFVVKKPGLLKAPIVGRGGTNPYDATKKSTVVVK